MNGKSMRGAETWEVQRRGSQCPLEPGTPQTLQTSWKAGLKWLIEVDRHKEYSHASASALVPEPSVGTKLHFSKMALYLPSTHDSPLIQFKSALGCR